MIKLIEKLKLIVNEIKRWWFLNHTLFRYWAKVQDEYREEQK